jgi:hypothetical protein
VDEQKAFGGFGSSLNFRGAGYAMNGDIMTSQAEGRNLVWAQRLSVRMLLLPGFGRSVDFWGLYAGVRTAAFQFEHLPTDSTPAGLFLANTQPTVGLLVATPGDRLRFELDLAPAIRASDASRIASQAALAAALAAGPHDDLMFVPNLKSGGRIRAALSRRWDMHPNVSLGLGTEVQSGYAETRTPFGDARGTTGGGEAFLRFYLRDAGRSWVQGVMAEGFCDVGYTSIWSSDVVLPSRAGGALVASMNRELEVRAAVARFSTSVINGYDSTAVMLGATYIVDTGSPAWLQRSQEQEPEIQGLERVR